MRANKVSIALLLAVIATFAIGSETTNITKNVSICGVPLGTTYDSVAEMCEPAHAPQMFYRTFHYKGPNSPNTVVYDDNDRAKWLDGASLEINGRSVVKVGENATEANQKLSGLGDLVRTGGRCSKYSFGSQEVEIYYSRGVVEGVSLRKYSS